MKKLYKYLFMVVSAVALLPLMTACSDDESTDPYDVNYVYIYSPTEINGEMVYKGNGTFLTQIASERNLIGTMHQACSRKIGGSLYHRRFFGRRLQ